MTSGPVRIGMIIPGYNVSRTVADALLCLRPETLAAVEEIVFIDNCSDDDTLRIVLELQSRPAPLGRRLTVLSNSVNHGLGGSLKIGLAYLQRHGFSHGLIVHSDGQGDNEVIARGLLDLMRAHPEANLILASRFHPEADLRGYSPLRILGNRFFNVMTRLLTGARISDAGTGIMLFATEILDGIRYADFSSGLHFNPMLNIALYHRRDIHILETALHWKDSAIGSTVLPWRYVMRLLWILFNYRARIVLGLPGVSPHAGEDWLHAFPHTIHPAGRDPA
ncbi:MAG: glycosyltransferase family 2 protein [Magnetococcales bacterium]|nr:glycosyltransferase family 2 protein [Magnetococcales bacterium]